MPRIESLVGHRCDVLRSGVSSRTSSTYSGGRAEPKPHRQKGRVSSHMSVTRVGSGSHLPVCSHGISPLVIRDSEVGRHRPSHPDPGPERRGGRFVCRLPPVPFPAFSRLTGARGGRKIHGIHLL
ncbi:hypothetical protein GUJ93_ZPchr0005g15859 [Zizania palustris]|uniref:Uncharacterized protein n=1 Tax=Zizania palustris TaxID=103762 RepID=A0A8J5VR34_ZIZPA|nr:hypothetical protein GUJ93_ZPchr0005g15859 [Zizania palustris]